MFTNSTSSKEKINYYSYVDLIIKDRLWSPQRFFTFHSSRPRWFRSIFESNKIRESRARLNVFTGRKAVFQIAYRFIILPSVPSAITLLPFHFFEFLSTISFSSSDVDFLSWLITRFRLDHFQLNDTYSMYIYWYVKWTMPHKCHNCQSLKEIKHFKTILRICIKEEVLKLVPSSILIIIFEL